MTTTPSTQLPHANAVLEVSGVYMLMPMEDIMPLLPVLARARLVDRDWNNDSFKPSPKGRRAFTVTPIDEGEMAAILMRSSAT